MSIIKLNNRAVKDATAVGSITGLGNLVFISRSTASSSSSVSITSNINSTYKEYIFIFNNINVGTNDSTLTFNGSIDSGSNYNVTKTSSVFVAYHNEGGSSTSLSYITSYDLAQDTGFQNLAGGIGNGSDESASGFLHIFDPSDTSHVKHFMSRVQFYEQSDFSIEQYVAGYFNTTSAIDAIQFKLLSGNFSGTIDMYGVL